MPAAPSLLPTLALRSAVPHAGEAPPPAAACAVLVEPGVPDEPEPEPDAPDPEPEEPDPDPEPEEPEPDEPEVPEPPGAGEAVELAVPGVPEAPEPDAGAELELDEEQPVAKIAATARAAPVSDVRKAACAVKFIKVLSLLPWTLFP